jgi:polyphosphate kinase 2 (PPK2 family)
MNEVKSSDYKVEKAIKLSDRSTVTDLNATKKELKKQLEFVREHLGDFQNTLYAHSKYSVLVCLQGMDTSGKDSLIREVVKDFNVQGVVVLRFKVPTE